MNSVSINLLNYCNYGWIYAIIHKLMWEVLGVGWIKCGAYSILQRPM